MKQTKEAHAYKNHARKVDRNTVIRSYGPTPPAMEKAQGRDEACTEVDNGGSARTLAHALARLLLGAIAEHREHLAFGCAECFRQWASKLSGAYYRLGALGGVYAQVHRLFPRGLIPLAH